MLIKSATILCLCVALAQCASIRQRNIPVEVRYEEKATGKDLKESSEERVSNAIRNLDEKVQLSPDEVKVSLKNLPRQEEITTEGASSNKIEENSQDNKEKEQPTKESSANLKHVVVEKEEPKKESSELKTLIKSEELKGKTVSVKELKDRPLEQEIKAQEPLQQDQPGKQKGQETDEKTIVQPLRHLPAEHDEPKEVAKEEKSVSVKKLEEQLPPQQQPIQPEQPPQKDQLQQVLAQPQPSEQAQKQEQSQLPEQAQPALVQQEPAKQEQSQTDQKVKEQPAQQGQQQQQKPQESSLALKTLLPQEKVKEESVIAVKKLDQKQGEASQQTPLNLETVLQQAHDIISNGLKQLRDSFKPENNQEAPKPEQWASLEKAVSEYFEEEKSKIQLKQDQPAQQPEQNQNFFQTIANGFQTISNNFIQSIQGQNNKPSEQGDEGAASGSENQGGFQGFVGFFQSGVNNLASTISNLGSPGSSTSNTVLGDSEVGSASTAAPGFISNIVNGVQQFIGNIQGGSGASGAGASTQGDTGTSSASNQQGQGPVQVFQQIGNAIGNLIQGGARPPNSSGDEASGSTETNVNVIQSIGQNIGNAIQNFNPFRPQGGSGSQNPVQAGIQNLQNQVQQIAGQPSSEASSASEDAAPAKSPENLAPTPQPVAPSEQPAVSSPQPAQPEQLAEQPEGNKEKKERTTTAE